MTTEPALDPPADAVRRATGYATRGAVREQHSDLDHAVARIRNAGLTGVDDLLAARWHLDREIQRRAERNGGAPR